MDILIYSVKVVYDSLFLLWKLKKKIDWTSSKKYKKQEVGMNGIANCVANCIAEF